MILSRIAKAVREQNWFAVGIEFVIVILGVVIGFQITEWRGEQTNRYSERIYLSRLYEDMALSVCSLSAERALLSGWNQAASTTLNALLDNEPDAVAGDGFELVTSTRIQTGTPHRATLNELLSGGQMNLISNPELRAQIAAIDAELNSLTGYIQLLAGAQQPFTAIVHTRLRPARDEDLGVTYDFDTLASDAEFINALGQTLRITRGNTRWLDRMIDATDQLRLAIGRELNAGPPEVVQCATHEEDVAS